MKSKKKNNSKKSKYMITIYWSDEDKCFVAEVPELPGCATHGNTFAHAAKNAEDAIATWLDGAKEAHIAIPEPVAAKKYSGKFVLRGTPELHRKLAIKALQKGKSLNGLAVDLLEKSLSF